MSQTFATGLAVFFLIGMLLNLGFAAYYYKVQRDSTAGLGWGIVAFLYLVQAIVFLTNKNVAMPHGLRESIDALMGPVSYTVLSMAAFCAFIAFRRTLTQPHVAWGILNLVLLVSFWAVTDSEFRKIITKPDNVPIPLLIFSVGFFTWLALRRGVINDERMANGEAPLEKLEDDKVLVWPDLVYTELLAMIICTALLTVGGTRLKAPRERPAPSAKAPTPSKAPWFFLGLQEMLVYSDPWMAGVVLPTFIIMGLIAMPYIDFNR